MATEGAAGVVREDVALAAHLLLCLLDEGVVPVEPARVLLCAVAPLVDPLDPDAAELAERLRRELRV